MTQLIKFILHNNIRSINFLKSLSNLSLHCLTFLHLSSIVVEMKFFTFIPNLHTRKLLHYSNALSLRLVTIIHRHWSSTRRHFWSWSQPPLLVFTHPSLVNWSSLATHWSLVFATLHWSSSSHDSSLVNTFFSAPEKK